MHGLDLERTFLCQPLRASQLMQRQCHSPSSLALACMWPTRCLLSGDCGPRACLTPAVQRFASILESSYQLNIHTDDYAFTLSLCRTIQHDGLLPIGDRLSNQAEKEILGYGMRLSSFS